MKKSEVIKIIEDNVPHNWLDPMMTGDKHDKVIGDPPYTCRDVEILCTTIKRKLLDAVEKFGKRGN